MARKTQRLSRGEWAVMTACWKLGRSTARQVYEAMGEEEREYQTVKTLLDRIAAKGFLEVDKLGPLCLYTPTVRRATALRGAISEFMDTVLDHSLAPLFQHLAAREDIDDEELAELRKLVEAAERKRR